MILRDKLRSTLCNKHNHIFQLIYKLFYNSINFNSINLNFSIKDRNI